jgi:hypothetical protein
MLGRWPFWQTQLQSEQLKKIRNKNAEKRMAKKVKRTKVAWTKAMQAELRRHSKARTPVEKISKQMKRTVGALRQQAFQLGIGLGHQR